tara:strand:+ start:7133 stop:9184 length:2052 start_codon:yes stop_codon:yes gene_type:complete
MQKIQLYIQGQRLDTFTDESVVITQSIKNVKDIDKVFTDFTKTFSLPASKTNNKIFKHYYNFDIIGGFDARIRKPANIELNNTPFTEGLIKLEGVDLKDNKPHTYKITFFGNTVTLKDALGDDKLSVLNTLTDLNQTYDATSVRNALQDNPTTNNIIVPLITHTERLIYDSTTNDQTVGNLAFHTGHIKGVSYTELKYAIRLHSIIEAIESKYSNISFSDDFFVDTNAPYYNLFMWLHRKKGDVENLNENVYQSLVNVWTPTNVNYDHNTRMLTSSVFEVTGFPDFYNEVNLKLFPITADITKEYSVLIYFNGGQVYSSGTVSGNLTISKGSFFTDNGEGNYSVYIQSNSNISFTSVRWTGEFEEPFSQQAYTFSYISSSYNYSNTFQFDITQQIPDIKVIDFLSGLFKMFNLVAYVERNQTQITVKSLDSFYSNPSNDSPYEISKYVDVSKSQVNSALPYRKINFKHEDTKTFLAARHTQIEGETWGEAEYDSGKKLDGSIYDVKTPFAQMKYERFIDKNTSLKTTAQWGWFVNDNEEPYYGKPLLFYPIRITSGNSISFVNTLNSQTPLTTYNIPSNSVALSSATSSYNMNFNQEQNEWGALDGDTGFTNSLFEAYYKNYITSVFNESNRITKVTAYLPLRILRNYTLADRFVINGKSYKINSIKTNLKDGKSDLELLNDL